MASYSPRSSMGLGGCVGAKPVITCSPYITTLDEITINFHGESINEFMNMIRDLNQYVVEKQDGNTENILRKVREIMESESKEER